MAGLALAATVFAVGSPGRHGTRPTGNAPGIAWADAGSPIRPSVPRVRTDAPIVGSSIPARTGPLRARGGPSPSSWIAEQEAPDTRRAVARGKLDPAVQRSSGGVPMPAPITTFEGMAGTGPVPPDVEGDIGPSHYLQWVNTRYTVYNRSGAPLAPPAAGNSLFQSLPNPNDLCRTTNWGDPIVLYDQLADRWVLSQFAFQLPRAGPYFQCIAVSTSGNPLGSYCAYSFEVSANVWNDYGKIGLWPDAYYFSFNGVPDSGSPNFTPVAWAVERPKLLTCNPAQMVYFDRSNTPGLAGATDPMLPADLDGSALPPAGQPNPYLMSIDNQPDKLALFEFHVDWTNPAASTFTKKADLTVPAFDSVFSCHVPIETRQCIPQLGTSTRLDVLSQQLMKRLTYRRFAGHESLVVNQTVDADTDHAAVRWYELRDPHGTPTVYQSSTYAPDAEHRWMGSAAMDRLGDLAVGYSVSSANTYPSLRYAGRLAGDPVGSLTLDETSLVVGSGAQDGHPRWGDYQSLSIDPVDDCTFWFAGEYYPTTGFNTWHTRIGTFRFPGCAGTTAASIRSFAARRRGGTIEIGWRTASELQLLGFNVYRSAGAGPFRKLNGSLIRAATSGIARGSSYRFVDRTAGRRRSTYRLELVDRRGAKSWYGVGVAG